MESASVVIAVLVLLSSAWARDEATYPSIYAHQQLATRIRCQVEEMQHFRYSSATKLWGVMGGEILLNADVTLHCLGDDRGGKYERQALKYLIEVSNLVLKEGKEKSSSKEPLKRRKRGVGDFFTNAWDRMKKFFRRVFGGRPADADATEVIRDHTVDQRKEVAPEEPEEDFNMNDLLPLYSTPFQFVQLANGSIPEIRLSDKEVDARVKNFKRHLVDAFATQLNFDQKQKSVVETSVMGEHRSSYNISVNGETAPLNAAGWAIQKSDEPTVVVSKVVTGNDILQLAPSEALNDREKMELKLHQKQVFHKGKLLSSSGQSSLILHHNPEEERRRKKRDGEDDVTSYFKAHSTFSIELHKRPRRSPKIRRLKRQENTYSPASRSADVETDSSRQKLRSLLHSAGDMTALVKSLLNYQEEDFDEKMQIIFEMVDQEINLLLDNESDSVSNVVRYLLNKDTMQYMCVRNFSVCKDFLQLLALAGGPEAEKVLLFFLTDDNSLSPNDMRIIADILSEISRPSSDLLNSMSQLIAGKHLNPEILGSVCLGFASMGYKAKAEEKGSISRSLLGLLREREDRCHSDPLILDVLEAIGNLGCEKTVARVLEVSEKCRQDGGVQIASAHALRHFVHLPSVQLWMENRTGRGDCEITEAIVGTLMDKIQQQEMARDTSDWPRNGFNGVDKILRDNLHRTRCSVEDTVLYFKKKRDSEANEISRNYFGPGSEPWSPESSSRQRRALWDDLNCNEWTEDSKYRPIQDKEEFASDRATYNKRKSCLAFRRLGVKGANAEIYAGMFAGLKEPSDPPKYKMFTKFVSGLNFLGNQMEIGSFYFYHHSGRTKAYVRIMGKTRQEFTHDGCTPTDLRYRPLKHIPLYRVSISTVQLSLGIHLSSQLSMDTACPSRQIYQLEPLTNVRIGGEAIGDVLFSRGSASLGANFNYKLQFTFTPSPNMCLKGSHGYDPMSISFEAYYQLWNSAKNDWGKMRSWKPSFLSWELNRGKLQTWFDDTCIATDVIPSNVERELE